MRRIPSLAPRRILNAKRKIRELSAAYEQVRHEIDLREEIVQLHKHYAEQSQRIQLIAVLLQEHQQKKAEAAAEFKTWLSEHANDPYVPVPWEASLWKLRKPRAK